MPRAGRSFRTFLLCTVYAINQSGDGEELHKEWRRGDGSRSEATHEATRIHIKTVEANS